MANNSNKQLQRVSENQSKTLVTISWRESIVSVTKTDNPRVCQSWLWIHAHICTSQNAMDKRRDEHNTARE